MTEPHQPGEEVDDVVRAIVAAGADAALLARWGFDAQRFVRFRDGVASGRVTPSSSLFRGVIERPRPGDVEELGEHPAAGRYRAAGEAMLARGEVAVLVVAGGMATRFRAPGAKAGEPLAKGTVPLVGDKSFLEVKIDDARRAGAAAVCIMGSFATLPGERGIEEHLVKRGLAGPSVLTFAQSVSLRLDEDGRLFGAGASVLPAEAYTTPGHGEVFAALVRSGVLDVLRDRGVRVLFFCNVDNAGASLDASYLGWFAEQRARGVRMAAEVVQRAPEDGAKVGAVARCDGRLRILEGFRVPDDKSALLTDVSINSFYFDVALFDRELPLETHAVEKKVDGRTALQGELVTCEVTGLLADGEFAALRVPREERFLPTKTPDDLVAVQRMLTPRVRVARAFRALPTTRHHVVRAFAPGRINIIGDHTDYTGGFVLPAAVDRGVALKARRRDDRVARLESLDQSSALLDLASSSPPRLPEAHAWARYAVGVVQALRERGIEPCGVDVVLAGDVPRGSGMSSSTALCCALAGAWSALSAPQPLDADTLALVAQRAEHVVGVNCGIMDQWCITHGEAGHALMLDCRSLRYERVPLKLGDAVLLVANTGKERGLVDSAYNTRRQECEQAATLLGRHLREATVADLRVLPPHLVKRARHVILENERVQRAAAAVAAGNVVELGTLLDASHASLRDDFEVSCAELDTMVELLRTHGALGARLMGGGFGGSTISVVPANKVEAIVALVGAEYRAATQRDPSFHVVVAGDGSRIIMNDA